MKLEEIENKIQNLDYSELKMYTYENIHTHGFLIMKLLLDRFYDKNEIEIADIITELFIVEIPYWEGISLFQIYFYEQLVKLFPNSILYLECVVSFGLPPFNKNAKEYFNFEFYYQKLKSIAPESLILKKIDELI